MQHTNKDRIKELRLWAKENIAGKEVYHAGLNFEINMLGKSSWIIANEYKGRGIVFITYLIMQRF